MNVIDIQIIGEYDLCTDELNEGGYSAFITHTYSIKNRELDNKILDGKILNGNLYLSRKGEPKLIYSAFPDELLAQPYQIYILDLDRNGEATLAIKVEMTTLAAEHTQHQN